MLLSDLTDLLNSKILIKFNTVIIGGFNEPFYQAAIDGKPAEIQFSHDYIRSALHELSHWCVAGVERRKIDDFGYWYVADGRDQKQQNEFFKLEIKPQAIEWAFSIICGVKFEASVDNLDNPIDGVEKFKQDLVIQIKQYLQQGFTQRVETILSIFAKHRGIKNISTLISLANLKNNTSPIR